MADVTMSIKGSSWDKWIVPESLWYHWIASFNNREDAWKYFIESPLQNIKIITEELLGQSTFSIIQFDENLHKIYH